MKNEIEIHVKNSSNENCRVSLFNSFANINRTNYGNTSSIQIKLKGESLSYNYNSILENYKVAFGDFSKIKFYNKLNNEQIFPENFAIQQVTLSASRPEVKLSESDYRGGNESFTLRGDIEIEFNIQPNSTYIICLS